jgi:hypothetical protein
MKALADLYPTLVRLRTAQDRYDLPTAGTCSEDLRGVKKAACRVWILEIGQEGSSGAKFTERPQVLLSGALHGNERIGPTTLVELATFLLGRYRIDPWIKRLLDTRVVVIVPAANGIGYYENRYLPEPATSLAHSASARRQASYHPTFLTRVRDRREELGVDPNRDFAYDTTAQNCMRTVAARALNELWRSSAFAFAVTFHGGDNLLAFPWGDTAHCPGFPGKCKGAQETGTARPKWIAPDHTAMSQMAKFTSDYAGQEANTKQLFRHGPLNDPKGEPCIPWPSPC